MSGHRSPVLAHEVFMRDLTMQFDPDDWFPFVEDENCNITGPLHQDAASFAAAVNRYDEVCTGAPLAEDDQWGADVVSHAWVTLNDDQESLTVVPSGTPGAFPVTTLWGQR